MNRRTLITLVATAVILIGGITFAVKKLYSGTGNKPEAIEDTRFLESHRLLKAVPSDAAIVFCFKNFGRACEILGDSLAVFGELGSTKFDRIASINPGGLRKAQAIMSVHYSKDMPPLLVIEAGKEAVDTTQDLRNLLRVTEASGLFSRISGNLVLVSSSETILNSSIRHLEEGHSVIEAQGFVGMASRMNGDDVIFFSNAYTDKILGSFLTRKHRGSNPFVRKLAEWTAFNITEHSPSCVRMHGEMLYSNEPSCYLNVLSHAGVSKSEIADAVPGNVDFILDLPIGSVKAYIKAYRNYLDSESRLDKYDYNLGVQKKATGRNAEEWAQALDIKEIAIANLHIDKKLRKVLLIKPGAKQTAEAVKSMACTEYAGELFGGIFTDSGNEASCSLVGKWIVAGDSDCVSRFAEEGFLTETLAARLKSEGLDRLPAKNCGAWMYHSLSEDPNLLDVNFSPMMAKGLRNVLKGSAYVPVTLSAVAEEGRMALEFTLDRVRVSKGTVALASFRDTTLAIPAGPFKVRNSATGKTNTIYQNSHLSICLQDENGKDVWGVPFKSKICGYVREVDYYNNGKLQYLFAAGSQMYLIDRLGRFVSGFPVETGKKIAAGPAVYDFTGAKGYTAMVLHSDNTVGYYDLHGKQVLSWKGITADETIKSLPELLEGNGKRYWVVRTSLQAMVFPFRGGAPLAKGEGNKMIRPDSKIEMTDKGFGAVCYDGKERIFKAEK